MTIVARRVAAVPARSSSETWGAITDLLCERNEEARIAFGRVTGVLASLIADRTPEANPITVVGTGPRVRVYCLYGDAALEATGEGVAPLAHDPLADDWTVYVPAFDDDLDWVCDTLTRASNQFVPYSTTEGLVVDDDAARASPVEVSPQAWRDL